MIYEYYPTMIHELSTMNHKNIPYLYRRKTFYRCQLVWRRKVRATQSILLPNGKAPAAGDSKVPQRKYRPLRWVRVKT